MRPLVISEITEDEEYMECVRDILCHPVFQSTDQYIQYGITTCKTHCMQVSYLGYKLYKQLGEDRRSAAWAGLLHDLFLYDRHAHTKGTGQYSHGFTCPEAAPANADRYFRLTREERMIILRHIWPLTLIPPAPKAGYVAICTDRYCSIMEAMTRFKHWIRIYLLVQPAGR